MFSSTLKLRDEVKWLIDWCNTRKNLDITLNLLVVLNVIHLL